MNIVYWWNDTEILEGNMSSISFCTTPPIRTGLGIILGLSDGRPAINCLGHGIVLYPFQ